MHASMMHVCYISSHQAIHIHTYTHRRARWWMRTKSGLVAADGKEMLNERKVTTSMKREIESRRGSVVQ